MKKVTEQEWLDKAAGLAEWRKNRTSPPNLDLYKKIVSMVHVGYYTMDVGAGQCHLKECLPPGILYYSSDPFPISETTHKVAAEDFGRSYGKKAFDTVFMLSALDNVRSVSETLGGLHWIAKQNIVILTGIGIPPDKNHTHQIDRVDLVSVLGEPFQEVELLPKCFLFEWRYGI